MSAGAFASNGNVKVKNIAPVTQCCGSRVTAGEPGTSSYMVFTSYRCATSTTSINAKAAACALADADTAGSLRNATTKVTLTISQ